MSPDPNSVRGYAQPPAIRAGPPQPTLQSPQPRRLPVLRVRRKCLRMMWAARMMWVPWTVTVTLYTSVERV